MTVKKIGGAVRTITQNLCYVGGVLKNEGHLYATTAANNNAFQTMSKRFPVTFDPGDTIYYQSRYSLGTLNKVRLEPFSYTICITETW